MAVDPHINKRKRNLGDNSPTPSTTPLFKRPRLGDSDGLSRLSDEVLIRILNFVDLPDLTRVQRVSRRFDILATDPQLWKLLYYDHFVRPRASRIPGISNVLLRHSSRRSNWLDERHLLSENRTNWKAQYRLRRNWTTGYPRTTGFFLPDHAPPSLPLISMHGDYAVAADPAHGLRAWRIKGSATLIAKQPLRTDSEQHKNSILVPSTLALDAHEGNGRCIKVLVGFESGSWSLHELCTDNNQFVEVHHQPCSTHSAILATAYAHPYIATLNANHRFCIYSCAATDDDPKYFKIVPKIMCSLSSHSVQGSLSVSIRILAVGIMACIAFAAPSYTTGWNVGLQEVHVGFDGMVKKSRVVLAASTTAATLYSSLKGSHKHSEAPNGETLQQNVPDSSKPTSLSYAHPYLLVSYPNNTLAVHLVKSSDSQLSLSRGHCLWGHTSSVSDAQVGARGKAISASAQGDEVRVWDLEGLISSRKQEHAMIEGMPIQLQPDMALRGVGTTLPDIEIRRDHRVVGFDAEKIVTMREENERALIVYDFS